MILTDVQATPDGSAFFRFMHAGRTVAVRYIDGPTGERIRTKAEAVSTAALALLEDDATRLTVR